MCARTIFIERSDSSLSTRETHDPQQTAKGDSGQGGGRLSKMNEAIKRICKDVQF